MGKKERKVRHPGLVLEEEFMKPMGLTQYRLAKELQVTPIRVNQIIHGKRAITADTAIRLACLFKMDPLFWMNLQNSHDLEAAMAEFFEPLYRKIKPLVKERKKTRSTGKTGTIAKQYDRGAKDRRKTPEFSEILQEGMDRFLVNFKLDEKFRK